MRDEKNKATKFQITHCSIIHQLLKKVKLFFKKQLDFLSFSAPAAQAGARPPVFAQFFGFLEAVDTIRDVGILRGFCAEPGQFLQTPFRMSRKFNAAPAQNPPEDGR
jgi:hypothetical protein